MSVSTTSCVSARSGALAKMKKMASMNPRIDSVSTPDTCDVAVATATPARVATPTRRRPPAARRSHRSREALPLRRSRRAQAGSRPPPPIPRTSGGGRYGPSSRTERSSPPRSRRSSRTTRWAERGSARRRRVGYPPRDAPEAGTRRTRRGRRRRTSRPGARSGSAVRPQVAPRRWRWRRRPLNDGVDCQLRRDADDDGRDGQHGGGPTSPIGGRWISAVGARRSPKNSARNFTE